MFLARLIDRALDGHTAIAPRRASRYEADPGVAEPAWVEAEVEAKREPMRRQAPPSAEPVAAAAPARDAPSEGPGILRVVVEQAQAPSPAAPNVAPPREAAAPAAAIIERLEQLAPPEREPPAPLAPQPDAPEPPSATTHEIHTHERVETRHEPREIERRLEVLTREHLIERLARIEAGPPAPTTASPQQAASPPPAVDPLRPRAAQTPPPPAPPSRRDALPNVLAATPEPPAATVVQVTIGRVEVRNTTPPPASRATARPREPRVGLDDYLRRREQA